MTDDRKRMIVRFFRDDRDPEIREHGLTLTEARAHCNNPDNRGDDWFDGFDMDDEDA